MTRNGIIFCLLTILLAVYVIFGLTLTNSMAADARCAGVVIHVSEGSAPTPFVTPDDIDRELGGIRAKATKIKASRIPLQKIENRLNSLANIESANCVRLANDSIAIEVVPMLPVARVFDDSCSYYINKDGKHLLASTQYQLDVPVIIREKGARMSPKTVLPLIDRIESNDVWNELVTAIKIDRRGDVLLIPSIAGHIINFGDTRNADDKFRRLFSFYRQVMPVRGWNYFDTVSVKFANQVVGKVTPGARRIQPNQYRDEDLIEEIDIESMKSDSVDMHDIKPKIL